MVHSEKPLTGLAQQAFKQGEVGERLDYIVVGTSPANVVIKERRKNVLSAIIANRSDRYTYLGRRFTHVAIMKAKLNNAETTRRRAPKLPSTVRRTAFIEFVYILSLN